MVREHRQQLGQLKSLADADLAALLRLLDLGDVAGVRNTLIGALPDILRPYMTAAGELAAVLFEDLRSEAALRGAFYAEAAAVDVSAGRVDSLARWAVSPLADDSLNATPLSRLSGAASRLIFDASRDTVLLNGSRETFDLRYQRMPRPGCCAFCGMLASRPYYMAYKSEASAGGVVGRGSNRTGLDASGSRQSGGVGGGVNARGSRTLGSTTHDDCHCIAVPMYPGTEMASVARETQKQFEGMYQQSLTGDNNEPLSGTKEILAEWRSYHGTK